MFLACSSVLGIFQHRILTKKYLTKNECNSLELQKTEPKPLTLSKRNKIRRLLADWYLFGLINIAKLPLVPGGGGETENLS